MKNPLALRPEDNAENLGARRGSNGLASLRIGRQENSANGLGGL